MQISAARACDLRPLSVPLSTVRSSRRLFAEYLRFYVAINAPAHPAPTAGPCTRAMQRPAPGYAASGDRATAIVLFVDELQYVPEEQLASLIAALHSSSQEQLPITMVAAGLPQLVARTGDAKSYAERLFEFAPIDRLDDDARDALTVPASREGVAFNAGAISEVLRQTNGYPYFLQEWGKHCWDGADASPIELHDAQRATVEARAELDASFSECASIG